MHIQIPLQLLQQELLHKAVASEYPYAAVIGQLELTLLKGRQRFDTISTLNLKVY